VEEGEEVGVFSLQKPNKELKAEETRPHPCSRNCLREDNDYAVSWIHRYGRGRVFYCSLGHNPYVFWDTRILKHFLAGIQFALGDLVADTTPSARQTKVRNPR
jgi:type 1 glutamine amidotransferase